MVQNAMTEKRVGAGCDWLT